MCIRDRVLAQFISDQEMIINQMIDRYTKEMRRKIYSLTTTKAKLNNADTFKKILLEYQNKMTTNNIIYIENQYNELNSLANN